MAVSTPARKLGVVALLVLWASSQPGVESINPVLNLNDTFPYLISKTSGQVIEPRDYMDFENIYTPNDTYSRQTNAPTKLYHLIKGFDFANYYQTDHWHYSDPEDLRQSAFPVANSTVCAFHLDWLENKLNSSQASLFGPGEQRINLMNLVDAFGKPEAETYQGRNQWLGSFEQCKRVSIDLAKFESADSDQPAHQLSAAVRTLRARYCIGKGRDVDWPANDDYVPKITYKIGLCLPESCETLSIQNHRDQLERLMLFSMPDYIKPRLRLTDLYCLPDRRSPVRSLSLSARIFLSILAIWIVSVVASTLAYSCYKRHRRDLRTILRLQQLQVHDQSASLASGHQGRPAKLRSQTIGLAAAAADESQQEESSLLKNLWFGRLSKRALDMAHKPAGLREPDSSSSSLKSSRVDSQSSSSVDSDSCPPTWVRVARSMSVKENLRDFMLPPPMLRDSSSVKKLRINLNALDAIKCLCCILVIFGHIVFIHMQHLSNIILTIELSHEVYPRILIAFFNFVDTFFIISGMLTAYFVFKRFNQHSFDNPTVWLQVILLRLIRLSPVYVLAFWFVKTLGVHLSEGPIWDYGTDRNSIKGLCINDHWWKSILYLGNVNSMQPLCILPAWSIIVDSQYSLVIPPVLFLLMRHKKLGYLSLMLAIVISTLKMSLQLMSQTAVKTSDMAKVRLHVYPLISRFAAEFYNSAWNRMGPVAIGIIGGHLLYLYDIKAIRKWPWYMRGLAFRFALFMHLFIFILPTIGRYTDNPESRSETDVTIFVLSNASIKPIWSIINTIFLLRLITDLRISSTVARLMSHNLWHCMGKLCFASYLIHYEIIMLLLKSRPDGLPMPTWLTVLREFATVFLISTVISYFIYILYESPVNKLSSILLESSRPRRNNRPSSGDDQVKSDSAAAARLNGFNVQPATASATTTALVNMEQEADGGDAERGRI